MEAFVASDGSCEHRALVRGKRRDLSCGAPRVPDRTTRQKRSPTSALDGSDHGRGTGQIVGETAAADDEKALFAQWRQSATETKMIFSHKPRQRNTSATAAPCAVVQATSAVDRHPGAHQAQGNKVRICGHIRGLSAAAEIRRQRCVRYRLPGRAFLAAATLGPRPRVGTAQR